MDFVAKVMQEVGTDKLKAVLKEHKAFVDDMQFYLNRKCRKYNTFRVTKTDKITVTFYLVQPMKKVFEKGETVTIDSLAELKPVIKAVIGLSL